MDNPYRYIARVSNRGGRKVHDTEAYDTREQAIARMRIALSEMVVEGILTNLPLHREMLNDTRFLRGGVSIHYLEQKLAQEQKKKK